jgi:hypothetical protein
VTAREGIEFLRAAMATGVLISFEVSWTLAPLLDLLEELVERGGAPPEELPTWREKRSGSRTRRR